MSQQPRNLAVNRETPVLPYLLGKLTSDREDDPNVEAEHPLRRGASIRARAVIANACGVRNKKGPPKMPSQRSVKKESESGTLSVENFLNELEEDLKLAIKTETKPIIVKKLEDKPRLVNGTLSASDFGSPLSDAPPSLASAPASSQKRPREVFDCVLLTSRKQAPKRRRIDSREDSALDVEDLVEVDPVESSDEVEIFEAKMKKWKNDKVKKNEDRCLLPETLRARIRPIGFDVQDQYITVDNVTREHMVTRQFMSETYGGSPQEVQPTIGDLYRIDHDMDDFFYMNTEYQPEAPEVPGAPGLWFSTESGSDIGERRVFTKIKDKTAKHDNKWLYVGQYNLRAANPSSLTVAEWRAQPAIFHNKWAHSIVTSGWGASVCIRLYGRKLYNRNPTASEYKKIGKSGKYNSITEDEVKKAYFSGQERMGVWTAKCIGYDNAFQQEISERFTPDWVPMTKEEREAWKKRQKEKIRLAKEEAKRVKVEEED